MCLTALIGGDASMLNRLIAAYLRQFGGERT
jgi:hypothetical protein